MTSHINPNPSSSSPKRKIAQSSSDRLSKIPKLKVPGNTPTDPSQPNHSRSRNLPKSISTDNRHHRHHHEHHPHHGFIHPPHDSTLFSPTNTSSALPNSTLSEGVIPPFTSPTVPLSQSQPFSDQDTPTGTEDAAGLGAPPNLANDLEEALMEEVEKNPGLAQGLRIEDLASQGNGGSNLTPEEVAFDIDVDINQDKDEITWETDEEDDEEETSTDEKDKEFVESSVFPTSDSHHSSDSGYNETTAPLVSDINMDTGLEYDEGYVEGADDNNFVDASDEIDWNNMSNDIDADPYARSASKLLGERDVQMNSDGVYGDWDGVIASEPGGDEAVDGYERTGHRAQNSCEGDVWWLDEG
ncbi:uncharacterized protein EAF01_001100 [Botrytis porri]|uniref:Uncharacterized protein n=1 Tax=Botrytis porri TaxID=87229 RepID=A0A4Z1KH98_9HELO|nr:uncharacterized protein EAF01_001100 [Botrytis porri]KAF7914694.1 hypothetical protein EAF01_001100 [Botrytis porri]TGO85483.1 hypothetical protein BPOR_0392g00080 [Botrytis porri]